jgi:hypothetical protein
MSWIPMKGGMFWQMPDHVPFTFYVDDDGPTSEEQLAAAVEYVKNVYGSFIPYMTVGVYVRPPLPGKIIMICDRCRSAPGTRQAREICDYCDDVYLCQDCFDLHAQEIQDDTT